MTVKLFAIIYISIIVICILESYLCTKFDPEEDKELNEFMNKKHKEYVDKSTD